jgi:hypothetical protein
MHQVATPIWNQIADQQRLRTTWAMQMFPMDEATMDAALEREEARIAADVGAVVAAAYLKFIPFLWEETAISRFLSDNPNCRAALMPLTDVSEAVMIASKDFPLTMLEKKKLATLLRKQPT